MLEPLSGYLTVAERLHEEGSRFAEAWNFAPARRGGAAGRLGGRAPRTTPGALAHLAGCPTEAPKPHEAIYLKLDASKAKARLGWRPRLALEETLVWVVDWYKRVHGGADAYAVTEEQIRRYEALA